MDPTFVDGKDPVRLYTEYHDNGSPKIAITYMFKLGEGLFESFYPSGNRKMTCYIIDGELNGLAEQVSDEGDLKLIGNYTNGRKVGPWRVYKNGRISMTMKFPMASETL